MGVISSRENTRPHSQTDRRRHTPNNPTIQPHPHLTLPPTQTRSLTSLRQATKVVPCAYATPFGVLGTGDVAATASAVACVMAMVSLIVKMTKMVMA